jgi:hypothetical protein
MNLLMVLLVAVPQASSSSSSSIGRETETGPDELASRHIIRSASNAGATNAARTSFERSSVIIADDKIVRRQVKAGKKAKLPVFVKKAKPSLTNSCGPTPPSPLPCSAPPVSDGTATLTAVCPDCAGETMTASQFEKLLTAPTPTCSALGYKALLGTSTIIPSVECLSSYLQEAAAAKTADSGIPETLVVDDFDQVMIYFCVHQCSQEYWDGLASELEKNDVNAFIGTNACLGVDACSGIAGTSDKPVTIGDGSCTELNSCKGITVDVGQGSCTYAFSCSCDGFAKQFHEGVPDKTCIAAGEGGGCCPD